MVSAAYVKAERGSDGRYRLFYRGTRNELFPGETWPTAAAARRAANPEPWTAENMGDGRYHVRGRDGYRRPGIVVGGRRTWAVELCGETIGHYPSVRAACAALYSAGDELYRRRPAE